MLLAMYGMFAVGKTTKMLNSMDDWADNLHPAIKEFVCVAADNAAEYHLQSGCEEWTMDVRREIWKRKQEAKLAQIDNMIADHDRLWIVESARWFGGLHQIFIDSYQRHHGGLKFIIPYTSEQAGRQFMIERCIKRHKEFREDYWTTERLGYEVKARYINVMNRRYLPVGIECKPFEIDYKRTAWKQVDKLINYWLAQPSKFWYTEVKQQCTSFKSEAQTVRARRQ